MEYSNEGGRKKEDKDVSKKLLVEGSLDLRALLPIPPPRERTLPRGELTFQSGVELMITMFGLSKVRLQD